jgi:hypothetical protein
VVKRFFQGTGKSYDCMVNAATFGITGCGSGVSSSSSRRSRVEWRIWLVGSRLHDRLLGHKQHWPCMLQGERRAADVPARGRPYRCTTTLP